MSTTRRVGYVLVVVLAAALAWTLRERAVHLLPIDFDEDEYMRAAQQYAVAFQSGSPQVIFDALTQQNHRPEHPPLMKFAFGLALAQLPPIAEIPDPSTATSQSATDPFLPRSHLEPARTVSALFATVQVLLLGLVSPIAAVLLAIHTYQIKYTSQVMLEALPALTSMLCVLLYMHWRKRGARISLALAAVMLGLTAASKYLYCVAGLAVLIDWMWTALERADESRKRATARTLITMIAWGVLALAVFIITDPYLWPDPIGRLMDSVLFHSRYSQGADVQRAGFPFWQPFVYLFSSFFFNDNRNAIFVITLDVFITAFAIYGLRRAWRAQRVMMLWLMVALVFLLLWNTKWPQYLLILAVPLCYAAAEGLKTLRDEFINWLKRRRAQQPSAEKTQTRAALPWLLPGLIALTVLALLPLLFQVMMSLTDFSAQSIRDGINGGVFREVWLGLTGQHASADLSAMRNNKVDYVGATLLTTVFGGTAGEVGNAMAFSVVWTICSVALQTALGISVALLLNRPFVRGAHVWRALFVLPWAIPEFVGGLAWRTMFHPNSGVLAAITGSRVMWQESSGLAFAVLLIAGTWMGFPIIMLAATAALKLMPADANEAAAIDGAAGWQAFWWITLPLMLPLVVPALIIRVISTFNQFYLFYSMETYEGTLATLSYFVFTPLGGTFGMGGGLYAVSAALNVFIVTVLLLLLVWFKRRREVTEGVTYA